MDLHLLRVLVELHRQGTMRAVAKATGYGTSTVSVQLATLEKQVGATLLERVGRTVRFTPAGRRLVEHAEQILAAVEIARADIGPSGEPGGLLRIAAPASVLSDDLISIAARLRRTHPALRLEMQEREPAEVAELLDADEVDLGFVYDYNVVPRFADNGTTVRRICSVPVLLAVPAGEFGPVTRVEDLRMLQDEPWVANSRGIDDTELVEFMCGMAGFTPTVAHRADSLGLAVDFVAAGLGVAFVPAFVPVREGVEMIPLPGEIACRRMFAVTRPGRHMWPAVALVVDEVAAYRG
ncbi:LysR family transcriptional regulator [Phytomonospora sp. NPDC050363]|uniref:LysR family transcriptional regulator n=1 Tax=Phytomonospora sp. NPDC050363 TaxID=3155642 RepID=UPI0033CF93EE